MDEGLLQLALDCSGLIGALLIDPVFIVLAIATGLAWMFGGQTLEGNRHPLRIAAVAAGVLAPQAIYFAVRIFRGEWPQGFEAGAALVFSMAVASLIVMYAIFGVMLAVGFVMTVTSQRK